jgi:hypothetical protein
VGEVPDGYVGCFVGTGVGAGRDDAVGVATMDGVEDVDVDVDV